MTRTASALVLCLALLAGCAARVQGLVHEDGVAELAPFRAATRAVPNHTVRVDVAEPGHPARHLALHRLDAPEQRRILVFVHGILSDHRAWRFVAGDLARDHGVWLLDLPGTGESDIPAPTSREPEPGASPEPDSPEPGRYAYTIPAMARDALTAVRHELAAAPPAARLTLVGHSMGGQLVLRAMGDPALRAQFADVLSRVDSLVLLAPLDIAVYRQDAFLRRLATAPSWEMELADATGRLRSLVERRTLESSAPSTPALVEEADLRETYLADAARRRAQQAMIARAVPWLEPDDRRPDWSAMETIEAWQRTIDVPTLIVWGRRDEILPLSMGYKLAAELPRARLVTMPEVMHSPQIERPGDTLRHVRDFLARLP